MGRGARQEGFTFLELMITVVLSVVIVGGVYMLYVQSVSAYRAENQQLDMQERLRFGLEHLKRDLRRAGYLSTPNSEIDENLCPLPDNELRAVMVLLNSGSVYQPWPGSNPNIQPASLTLFGDFYSGQTFMTSGIQTNKVYLDTTSSTFPSSAMEFNRIFNSTHYLRIVTKDQFDIMLPILTADWAEASITLTKSVPQMDAGSLCGITGFGEGLDVSVSGFVRYRIAADVRPGADVGKTDLIREELAVDGVTLVQNSVLVIADYAADLQFYDFGFDMDATGTAPSIVRFALPSQVADQMGGGLLGDTTNAEPHNLRYMTVKLTVRAEEEDPTFSFVTRDSVFDPLDGYEIDEMEGACRTLSLASRVNLTSLAVRNLKE